MFYRWQSCGRYIKQNINIARRFPIDKSSHRLLKKGRHSQCHYIAYHCYQRYMIVSLCLQVGKLFLLPAKFSWHQSTVFLHVCMVARELGPSLPPQCRAVCCGCSWLSVDTCQLGDAMSCRTDWWLPRHLLSRAWRQGAIIATRRWYRNQDWR